MLRNWLGYQRRYWSLRRHGETAAQARFLAVDGLLSHHEARCLFQLAQHAASGAIVEVGTFHGKSSIALAAGTRAGKQLPVYAIDPYTVFVGPRGTQFGPGERIYFLENVLWSNSSAAIFPINLPSAQVAGNWASPVSLLWLDGDHSYQGVKTDWDCWLPHLTPDARIAFHDSFDPQMGVLRLLSEINAAGLYKTIQVVDRITVLARAA